MRHAISTRPGDINQRKKQKEEIENYIINAYNAEEQAALKDVYVTDHFPKTKKFATTSKKEDEQFFRYKQALQDYNSEELPALPSAQRERFERGSMLQRIFDPLAGARKLENGAYFYKVADSEIHVDEEKARAEYERLKNVNSGTLEVSEDDLDELRIALISELEQNSPLTIDEFNSVLDKEFSVFKEGEKYDFVKDMRDAFASGLERPAIDRIMDTIPDHAFWDIKLPQQEDPQRFMNPYNSFRQYHISTFFDAREYEEYMDRRNKKNNLRDSISTRRRY